MGHNKISQRIQGSLLKINLKDAIKKIIVSSYISALYDDYNILTFYGSNKDLPLKISCPINIEDESLRYFLISFEKLLQKGTFETLKNFIKKNIFK